MSSNEQDRHDAWEALDFSEWLNRPIDSERTLQSGFRSSNRINRILDGLDDNPRQRLTRNWIVDAHDTLRTDSGYDIINPNPFQIMVAVRDDRIVRSADFTPPNGIARPVIAPRLVMTNEITRDEITRDAGGYFHRRADRIPTLPEMINMSRPSIPVGSAPDMMVNNELLPQARRVSIPPPLTGSIPAPNPFTITTSGSNSSPSMIWPGPTIPMQPHEHIGVMPPPPSAYDSAGWIGGSYAKAVPVPELKVTAKFEVGGLVSLKSSPFLPMTIETFDAMNGPIGSPIKKSFAYTCWWFDSDNKLQKATFREYMLMAARVGE